MDNYFSKRDSENFKKLNELIKGLPSFSREFFIGISNQTTVLTRLNYAHDLKIFFYFLTTYSEKFSSDLSAFTLDDLERISIDDIELFLNFLTEYSDSQGIKRNGETGKARKLATVRSFFKYFFNKDKISKNITTKVSMPKRHDKEIIRLEVDEVVKILTEAESGEHLTKKQKDSHDKNKDRDFAILSLFLGTGIRISELVGLNISDIDFSTNGFVVTRKGGNRTVLYFPEEIKPALQKQIENRNNQNQKKDTNYAIEPLFLGATNRISVRTIQNLVEKYARIVSPLKKISPHKLRSTYGTNLYAETNDIYMVAEVLGHKDVNTTKKHYAAISDEQKRQAAKAVKLRKD